MEYHESIGVGLAQSLAKRQRDAAEGFDLDIVAKQRAQTSGRDRKIGCTGSSSPRCLCGHKLLHVAEAPTQLRVLKVASIGELHPPINRRRKPLHPLDYRLVTIHDRHASAVETTRTEAIECRVIDKGD